MRQQVVRRELLREKPLTTDVRSGKLELRSQILERAATTGSEVVFFGEVAEGAVADLQELGGLGADAPRFFQGRL